MTEIKPNNTIDQDQINRTIWEACDTFRGLIDPSIYKDYVLTMLFLKYISDVWQDHYDAFQAKHGDYPELIEEFLKHERFVLPSDSSYYVLCQKRHLPGNGARIDQALASIARSNTGKLANVFQDIQFNSTKLGAEKQKNDILCQLLEDFDKPELNLRPSRVGNLDIIGNAYEFLIRNFASGSGKKAGEFYTPPEISELIALLVDPQENDTICDPTCGSGSLLMKCGKLVQERHTSGNKAYHLYGQEAIGSTWALAKMNMFLHSEDNHQIEWGDTLREPKLTSNSVSLMQFDVVVANPPFSLEKWGHEKAEKDPFKRFARGIPPRTKADYAFILHMIASMKPETGRMAVVVPAGVLFRKGKEAAIREHLIKENLLTAVIALPEKLFYGTSIGAVILFFHSKKSDDNILFINASTEFQDNKAQNLLRAEDIERIWSTFKNRSHVHNYAHLASREEVINNKYSLSISQYVIKKKDESPINLKVLRQERDLLTEQLAAMLLQMDSMIAILIQEPECAYLDDLI
jgi:type I restriction enzyme M protein